MYSKAMRSLRLEEPSAGVSFVVMITGVHHPGLMDVNTLALSNIGSTMLRICSGSR